MLSYTWLILIIVYFTQRLYTTCIHPHRKHHLIGLVFHSWNYSRSMYLMLHLCVHLSITVYMLCYVHIRDEIELNDDTCLSRLREPSLDASRARLVTRCRIQIAAVGFATDHRRAYSFHYVEPMQRDSLRRASPILTTYSRRNTTAHPSVLRSIKISRNKFTCDFSKVF